MKNRKGVSLGWGKTITSLPYCSCISYSNTHAYRLTTNVLTKKTINFDVTQNNDQLLRYGINTCLIMLTNESNEVP